MSPTTSLHGELYSRLPNLFALTQPSALLAELLLPEHPR